MIIALYFAVMIIGYLLGSIPCGYMIAQRKARVDIRNLGSGSTGTTNVLRTVGGRAAVLVVVLDILKGAIAVILAGLIVGDNYLAVGGFGLGRPLAQVLAALAAIVGHNWSVFLGFKGGRGVATYFGGMVALLPMAALFGGELLLLGAVTTRFMSIGSIAGVVGSYSLLVPLTIINGLPLEYLAYALIGVVVILIMHRGNISRLLAGKERRLGDKVTKTETSSPVQDRG